MENIDSLNVSLSTLRALLAWIRVDPSMDD